MRNFILAILLISGITGFGQTGVIKGTILTTDGQPAAYVNVTVPSLKKGTITSDNGSFMMRGIQPGQHQLVI